MNGFAVPDEALRNGDRSSTSEGTPADQVLFALADPDCRCILSATAGGPKTAGELSEECGVPSSTMYRKLDFLSDTVLLEEGVRVHDGGKHSSEYVATVEEVSVQLDGDRPVQVDVFRE